MAEKEQGQNEKCRHEFKCPICMLTEMLKDRMGNYDEFMGHVKNVESEVLMAVRSLIDQRLADKEGKKAKQATKIKVS